MYVSFLYLLFCLPGAVVDPVKEGTKAAVDFLISDLSKRALTEHKKRTGTSVKPEEDLEGVKDHDESLNFDR